jgi:Cytochrome P460
MKGRTYVLGAAITMAGAVAYIASATGDADADSSRVFAVTLPHGYRDWKLISVAHEEGNNNDLRAVLGNDVAIKAYRERRLPFPDGAIIARLAWSYVASEENNKAFGRAQSFVAGPPINVQVMAKDSTKYAATGGWGFGQFKDGEPDAAAQLKSCFPCHQPAKAQDLVFTHYSP